MLQSNCVDAHNIVHWRHPFTAIVAGPTGCGKTVFVKKLLKSTDLIHPPPQRTYWFYGQYQPAYTEFSSRDEVSFIQGLPDDILECVGRDPSVRKLIILDDLMSSVAGSKQVTNLFVQGSHHLGLSVICIMQNLFFQGPEMRTISLNAHYIVVFKNPREQNQVACLGRQIYGPGRGKSLVQAYNDATKKSLFGYLVINLKPDTDDKFRLVTNIFAEEHPTIVYMPK